MFTVRQLGEGVNVVQDETSAMPRVLLMDGSEIRFRSFREFFALVEDLDNAKESMIRAEMEELNAIAEGVK